MNYFLTNFLASSTILSLVKSKWLYISLYGALLPKSSRPIEAPLFLIYFAHPFTLPASILILEQESVSKILFW